MTSIRGITAYNTFIKDAFNVIYNRPCLNILPNNVKNVIWKRSASKTIIFKYKYLVQKVGVFTNQIYNNIVIYRTVNNKNNYNILTDVLFNLTFPIMYILLFFIYLIMCLS